MSDRIKKTWKVIKSFESPHNDYCVDIFTRPNGTFGFEEFRKDPEDSGKWTGIRYFSEMSFHSEELAIERAKEKINWL